MNKHLHNRILCLILASVLMLGLFPSVCASPSGLRWEMSNAEISRDKHDHLIRDTGSAEAAHKPTDLVRVSIVLEDTPTLRAGFSTMGLASDPNAAAHDLQLQQIQRSMEKTISAQALGGKPLDVVWNLTLAANIISANVPYGRLDAIRSVKGVRDVFIEQQYAVDPLRPDTATSGSMIGVPAVRQTGLTGAGTRIAIIDTGTDTDHQSFDNGAYLYSLAQNAADKGLSAEEYTASLDLLDASDISAVLEHLNAYERIGAAAADFYINEKLPFGANYVDYDLTVDHDHDHQGSHGSHVAGIAAANRYIPRDGGYADALQTVFMSGVAPDAQIITLKVFGNGDGPYDSDYFAAIEDAIWLGCDSVNLSLGSGAPGGSSNPLFAELLDYMATTDTLVVMSAGNSGAWADNTAAGALYHDGVSFHTSGTPGTYTNSLAVSSVDNDGTVGKYLDVAGHTVVYTEGDGPNNRPITSLDTSYDDSGTAYEYILIDGAGLSSDYDGLDLFGKVVFCARGNISFTEKATNAARLGAAALVVYNNTSGVFGMDLSDYRLSTPCASIIRQDAERIRAASTPQTTAEGLTFYIGTLTISGKLGAEVYGSEYDQMSAFSSWGVPGTLQIKPEIAAPGGGIWSINGVDTSGKAYEMMSGTSMAAPHVTGMAALVSEYIQSNGLDAKTGLSVRQLAQSLLMSTAQPLKEEASGGEYYSILTQGSGLARVDLATGAESYVLVDGMADGKVKVELGEDPGREGIYEFSFSINDLNGKSMVYDLSADLFTQAISGEDVLYLDKQTHSLPAKVQFLANGIPLDVPDDGFVCDLNGDGITNAKDADHLLEYLVGNADRLHDDGDVNADGTITSYDAHVLLSRLTGSFRVEVPAGGSVTVQVRLELTDDARSILASYPTGAYLEGFVFAAPAGNTEGVLGVTHSIPLLGYYGSWTEPGMYDVGSYAEYLAGSETRTPYLYSNNGYQSNFVSISYGGREEYLFGGNPYVREDDYLPRRNAFNNENGWVLQNLRFSLIRNASASMLLLENADTGEQLLAQPYGPMDGAYYHVNLGSWQNTQQRLSLGLDLAGIPEGTQLNLSLITAPELYCTYDPATGTYDTDWDALADGAYLTTTFTIDNTAPEIRNVKLGEDNVLRVTARDNEYIAAVTLLNATGSSILTSAAANQTEPGSEMTIELDLSQVYGSEFLVAVYDYAENESVCSVTLELDTQRPYFTLIDTSGSGTYRGLTADGSICGLAALTDRPLPSAAEYAEGAVFEISEDGKLYAAYNDDLFGFTCLGALDPEGEWDIQSFTDMAYNRCDGQLYALFYSGKNNLVVPYLSVIDPHTARMTVQGQMPIDANTITVDGCGNFYSTVYGTKQLYRYGSDVVNTRKTTFIGQTGGYSTTAPSSLAWDHNTGELYWALTSGEANMLLKLDPLTASPQLVCSYDFHGRGLYIAYEPRSDIFAPTDRVLSVTMPKTASTLAGNTLRLSATVLPWNVSNATLIWTSGDETVAAVDETGLVTGLSAGSTVITATSALDPTLSASCTVTVSSLNAALNALVWDQDGQVWWSQFKTSSLPGYEKFAAVPDNLPLNATMMADGSLYASSLDTTNGTSELYIVDPDTFEMRLIGPSSFAYLDMAYSPSLGYGMAVYFNYVLLIDLATGEYLGGWDWSEGMTSDLVGITYYGTEFNSNYGANMDYFLILDADGRVYVDAFINAGGSFGYFNGPEAGYAATIGDRVDHSYFQGFHYDGSYTYWTRFNEADNIVELIAFDCDGTGESYTLGFFDEGVWPVGGLYTDAQLSGTMPLADQVCDTVRENTLTTALSVQSLSGAKGAVNSAPASRASQSNSVCLTLTVPNGAMKPTNGTLTVTFDPTALELVSVSGITEAFAWNLVEDGKIFIAFADRLALSDGAVMAQLSFLPLGTGKTTVSFHYGQWNQWSLAALEEFEVELPKPHMPFSDVPEDSFFYDPVLWAISNGITTGATAATFDPNGDCLRASVVTFLWRASGCPEPTTNHNPFNDVKESDFFYKAVLWAVEKGITNGTSTTTFSPYAKCNRSQVVTFLWRAMGSPDPASAINPFNDVHIREFYGPAVLWAVEQGITNGMGDGTFGVGNTCNRAQVVTFLYRTLVK